MPIKGMLLILLCAAVFGYAERERICAWFEEEHKEDNEEDKEEKE